MADWLSERQLRRLIKELDKAGPAPVEYGEPEPEPEEALPAAWLEVRDGELILTPSGREGHLPVIACAPGITLFVNGEPAGEPREIRLEDQLAWEAEQKPLYRIEITEDRMEAWFVLDKLRRYAQKLKDSEPTDRLLLETEDNRGYLIETVTFEQIMRAFDELGIKGVDETAIRRELEHPTHERVLAAAGKPPVPGEDAKLDVYFKENIESSFEEINGFIDYRNHLKIPSVKKGDRIARKLPPKAGESGCDVFGRTIEPDRPRDLILLAKQYVTLTPDQEAIAMREGRPRITGDRIKFIDITAAHVVSGDVDLKSGNIVFSGDIIVYGNVTDGMIVEALGDVYVMGNVYRATVTATGSIYVKGNAIGSKLYSGRYGVLFNRLFNHSNLLNEQIKSLRYSADQLQRMAVERKQEVPERQLYQVLLESKYASIPQTAKEILISIANIQSIAGDQLHELKEQLLVLMRPSALFEIDIKTHFHKLQHLLIETVESIRRCEERDVCTEVQQCQLTEIMANGDILIRNQGVIQSKLVSKGNIIFFSRESACRGSELEAAKAIAAATVGGVSGGGRTMLKAGERITADYIYEGRVIVDRFAKDILEPLERVEIYVSKNRLVVRTDGGPDNGQERNAG